MVNVKYWMRTPFLRFCQQTTNASFFPSSMFLYIIHDHVKGAKVKGSWTLHSHEYLFEHVLLQLKGIWSEREMFPLAPLATFFLNPHLDVWVWKESNHFNGLLTTFHNWSSWSRHPSSPLAPCSALIESVANPKILPFRGNLLMCAHCQPVWGL